jgi:hypothetical protein
MNGIPYVLSLALGYLVLALIFAGAERKVKFPEGS